MSDPGFDPNRPVGIDRTDPVPDQDIVNASVDGGPAVADIVPGAGEIGRGPKDPGEGGAAGEQGGFADTVRRGIAVGGERPRNPSPRDAEDA